MSRKNIEDQKTKKLRKKILNEIETHQRVIYTWAAVGYDKGGMYFDRINCETIMKWVDETLVLLNEISKEEGS